MKFTKSLSAIVMTFISLLAVNGYSQSFLTNGLVAYYPFNGNADDASGNGKTGIVSGPSLTSDRFGNPNRAYSFIRDQTITSLTKVGISGNSDRTISAWIKSDSYAPWPYGQFIGWGHGDVDAYCFIRFPGDQSWTYPPQQFVFQFDANCVQVYGAPPTNILGSWHHLVWTYTTNLGNSRFFLDSKALPQSFPGPDIFDYTLPSATLSTVDDYLVVGKDFIGQIDDVRIYNRALSGDEVEALYEYESGPKIDLLKAVKPSFSFLTTGTKYQLQLSSDMNTWTNQGSPFTATNSSMVYPQYFDVENWGQLFIQLKATP
jgi:hypothetical protein